MPFLLPPPRSSGGRQSPVREPSRHAGAGASLAGLATRLVVVLALLVPSACGATRLKHERRYDQAQAQKKLAQLQKTGLVIGEFPLATDPVIDGDTIRVDGLQTSLRLLAIDAEETFKRDSERRAFEAGWDTYVKAMQGDSSRPVKMATPVGEEGKDFAKAFFAGVKTVRLERDHPKEIRDYYDRYLAYVFVKRDGKWVNYNVESVRAGMSPYFTKYGYSRRFHEDFVAAENEARAARRGIWDPNKQHYPDYAARKAWWDARAEFIKKFEADAAGQDNYIALTNWDAPARLEALEGQEVVVLGSVSRIKLGDRGPTKVSLSRRRANDFPLIFWDKDVFQTSGIERYQGEYVRVKGLVSKYANKRKKSYELQIVVSLPGQVEGADEAVASPPPKGSRASAAGADESTD